MLTGREHFYGDWLTLVRRAATMGPVLDLGTPSPFHKEMAALQGHIAEPYYAFDVVHSPTIHGVADGHRLPFRDGSVGTVLCSHVLEHVVDPSRVVAEVHRVLRPGGAAYLTFLDMWPYHGATATYPDLHRFKRDAVDLLLADWTDVRVLRGGGLAQVAVNYAPGRVRRLAQRIANVADRRWPTTATTAFYVTARKAHVRCPKTGAQHR